MNAMTDINTDVLTYKEGLAGRLRLNRPKALHSLNREMVNGMSAALTQWRDDPDVRIILIDHAEGRGFCAGGDVVGISQNVEGHEAAARAFFFDEYRLNHLEYTYPKPSTIQPDDLGILAAWRRRAGHRRNRLRRCIWIAFVNFDNAAADVAPFAAVEEIDDDADNRPAEE